MMGWLFGDDSKDKKKSRRGKRKVVKERTYSIKELKELGVIKAAKRRVKKLGDVKKE